MAPIFIATAFVEGRRRRDYSARRHPVSSLALGDAGWIQTANFLAGGSLICLFAIGARRARPISRLTPPPWMLSAAGLGLIGSGIFATDAVNGYPPHAPDRSAQRTRTGAAHESCAIPVMVGLPVAAITAGVRSAARGERRWAGYCYATAIVSFGAFIAAGAGFGGAAQWVDRAGLYQRVGIVAAFGWVSALAIRVRRRLR